MRIKADSIGAKFIKFCFVGGIGALINFALTFILTDWVGLWYMLSLFIATAIAMIWNFYMNYIWTFATQKNADDADYDWWGYHNGNPIQKWWKRSVADKIANMVEGDTVLDVGCGSSPLCTIIPKEKYVGLDWNPAKVEFMAAQQIERTEFRLCSIEQLTFNSLNYPSQTGLFDTVICSEVIEHVDDWPDANILVHTLTRMAKVGGVVIIATPNYKSRLWRYTEQAYKLFMPTAYGDGHVLQFGEVELKRLCSQSGLRHEYTDAVLGADLVCKFRKVADVAQYKS